MLAFATKKRGGGSAWLVVQGASFSYAKSAESGRFSSAPCPPGALKAPPSSADVGKLLRSPTASIKKRPSWRTLWMLRRWIHVAEGYRRYFQFVTRALAALHDSPTALLGRGMAGAPHPTTRTTSSLSTTPLTSGTPYSHLSGVATLRSRVATTPTRGLRHLPFEMAC